MPTALVEDVLAPTGATPDLPLAEWEAVHTTPRELLIGGRWVPARDGRRLDVEDPSTGSLLCTVADAGTDDAVAALAAADDAAQSWAGRAPRERARILRRAAGALVDDTERFAMLATLEMGRTLAESRSEVEFAAEYLDWCADEAVRVHGVHQESPDGTGRIVVSRRPVGPCLIVTPWNFPLAVPARGVAAALAAGCTAVLRPSALTPLSALALAETLRECGLPPGVLNVVTSSADGATDRLLLDPRLRRLTFTGGTAVGRHLIGLCADQVLRVGVELGGQAPFIVFEDADLDAAIEGAVSAKMRNGGQACTAANRFHVHAELAPEFTARLAARLGSLRLGRGTDPGTDLGPMITARRSEQLAELVDDAVLRGADVVLAGGAVPGPGNMFAPVVLRDVPDGSRILAEEIFGPIAPVSTFTRESEVVATANRCAQGLAGYVYTRDLDRALRVGQALEVGMVAINRGRVSAVASPFSGVKQSGYGCAGGPDPLGDYLETRSLVIGTP